MDKRVEVWRKIKMAKKEEAGHLMMVTSKVKKGLQRAREQYQEFW